MSSSGGASKGLAAQAINRVSSGGLARAPSLNRSITPRSRIARASASTSAPKTVSISTSTSAPRLGSSSNANRAPSQHQNATPKPIQARTSLSRQTPRTASPTPKASSPRRSRPMRSIEPLRSSGSLTPRPSADPTQRFRDSKALALLAKQLDDYSRRRYKSFMHRLLDAWGNATQRARLSHGKVVPFCMRIWHDSQCQVLAKIVNNWACFALRERALRAERQLAAERTALRHLSDELNEVRQRLRQAEKKEGMGTSTTKKTDLERVEEWEEQTQSHQMKEEEAPSEAEPVTEAEAEAEPYPAEPEPQPPSLNFRPNIRNTKKDIQERSNASAEKLEERVGAMILELHNPPSLPWPETPRVDVSSEESQARGNSQSDSLANACASQNSDVQQQKKESTQDSPKASMRVGSYPGRALLRRLAGPKLAGGKRRGLLDSSDSD